ncbi:MAG: exosortase/archaeosortase family protein [Candidatus Aenigmarchaeota archaeon]|nr:exosortase/archaeosortase family protein [Candidatus Aenigmarchaeota archaeon]
MKTKKEILKRRKKLLLILWFLIKLNILVIPLYVLLYLDFSFFPLQAFLTSLTGKTLQALGYPVSFTSTNLFMLFNSPTGYLLVPFEMTMDCTGWKTMYALAALTIATPKSKIKGKIKFLAIGLPFLFFLNFIRILTTLMFSFHFGYQHLEVMHTFLWREGLIFAVIFLWYLWLRRENII